MNTSFRISREKSGLAFPFGAAGVAGLAAGVAWLAGMLVPRSWLEALSFQLYLDLVIPAAKAPLGAMAQLLAAIALALIVGILAYAAARWLQIGAMAGGLSGLLARLRGDVDGDEEDAPPLRSADRHPDAPARRPFSVTRDIAPDYSATAVERGLPDPANDDDELLLDMAYAPEEEPLPGREPLFSPRGPALRPVGTSESFDLPPPRLEDWERPPFREPAQTGDSVAESTGSEEQEAPPAAVVEAAIADAVPMPDSSDAVDVSLPDDQVEQAANGADGLGQDLQSEAVDPAQPMPAASAPVAPRPEPRPPLDLSVARLDELIARLEAGLTRKGEVRDGNDAMPVEATDRVEAVPPPAAAVDDPAFPHDPALAAALATLRKMNRATA